MFSAWDKFPVDYTFKNVGPCSDLILDHILVPNVEYHDVTLAGVVHDVDNLSDHEPVYTSFKVGNATEESNDSVQDEAPEKKR